MATETNAVTTETELRFEKFINNTINILGNSLGNWKWPRHSNGLCNHGALSKTYFALWQGFEGGIAYQQEIATKPEEPKPKHERLSVFRDHRGQLAPSVGGQLIGNCISVTVQCLASGETEATIVCGSVEIEPN